MSSRPWLIGLLLVLSAAAGCLQEAEEEDPPEPFAVVTVTGEIVERGEERDPSACGRPLWSAGLSTDDRRLTVLERHVPEDPARLAVWDDVVEVHAGNHTTCEWPLLTLTDEKRSNWTLHFRDLKRSFEVRVLDEGLAVGSQRLDRGESREVTIDRSPEGSNHTYEGELSFTFHGFWAADRLQAVAGEDGVRGRQGVVKNWG